MLPIRFLQKNFSRQISHTPLKCYAASTVIADLPIQKTSDSRPQIPNEWQTAKPFEKIPGPSKLQFLLGNFPGGRFYGKTTVEMNDQLRKDYGNIYLVRGLFGKNDVLFTFNVDDFEKVLRAGGQYPKRRGFDIIDYYRKIHRPDIYKKFGGLVVENGVEWANFRSIVNPVMMNPKTFKLYTPKLNEVTDQVIAYVRKYRDPKTLEVPGDFHDILKCLSMETMGIVSLDTQFGLIDQVDTNEELQKFIASILDFSKLLGELQMKPSIWKYVPTPSFKQFLTTMDFITDTIIRYVEMAKESLRKEEQNGNIKPESEQSVFERLIKIDPVVATVLVIDNIIAGLDTNATGLASILVGIGANPEKQKKLRKEIMDILPDKETPLTPERMTNMPYLRACVKECLRLNPIISSTTRTTTQELVLSGYRIPKELDIIMESQNLLRDANYYPNPNDFIPERWLRNDDAKDAKGCPLRTDTPFVFLPFGYGARMCIGRRIVDLTLEVNVAKLVRNFEIGFDQPTEGIFTTYFSNVPIKPLKFKFVDVEK